MCANGTVESVREFGVSVGSGHKKVREIMRSAEKSVLASDPMIDRFYLSGFETSPDGAVGIQGRGYQMDGRGSNGEE